MITDLFTWMMALPGDVVRFELRHPGVTLFAGAAVVFAAAVALLRRTR